MVIISGKTFLKYAGIGVLLFSVGVGLAWLSEKPFFGSEIFPKKVATATPEPTVSPSATPRATSSSPRASASSKPGREYTVQPGDTISTIANANGIDFETLAEYNDIPYPYNLGVGQSITIPEK